MVVSGFWVVPTLDPEGTGGQDETGRYITFSYRNKDAHCCHHNTLPISNIRQKWMPGIPGRHSCSCCRNPLVKNTNPGTLLVQRWHWNWHRLFWGWEANMSAYPLPALECWGLTGADKYLHTHFQSLFKTQAFVQLWSSHFNSTRGEAWHGHVIANSEVSLAWQITVSTGLWQHPLLIQLQYRTRHFGLNHWEGSSFSCGWFKQRHYSAQWG